MVWVPLNASQPSLYHFFNNKEFFIVTFIDIRGVFDSVNIHILVDHLNSSNALPVFGNILISLFNRRNLVFSSSFGSSNIRSTYSSIAQSYTIQRIHGYYNWKGLWSLLIDCPTLYLMRTFLFSNLKSLNIPLRLPSVLNTKSDKVFTKITNFILEAGFAI